MIYFILPKIPIVGTLVHALIQFVLLLLNFCSVQVFILAVGLEKLWCAAWKPCSLLSQQQLCVRGEVGKSDKGSGFKN